MNLNLIIIRGTFYRKPNAGMHLGKKMFIFEIFKNKRFFTQIILRSFENLHLPNSALQ